MASQLASLRAAAIDGRAHNIYYRQHELEKLHRALIGHANEIQNAIAADCGYSPAEIAAELHGALSALKKNYASLQPQMALSEEYLLASGHDAPTNRRPAGIVYIEPCSHTLLYSIVAPVSAAMAEGNCVVVLLENNLRALTAVLRRILQQALHSDTFAVVSSPIRDRTSLEAGMFVDQNGNETSPKANHLASASTGRTFAVVDRTADIQLAARELLAARSAFDGRSPYAPDLVMVNEFVKSEFLAAVADESRKAGSEAKTGGGHKGKPNGLGDLIRALETTDHTFHVVLETPSVAVLDISARKPEILKQKIQVPALLVLAVKSLDDAIDFIGNSTTTPALAAYHFGNPAVGKYLAQFIDARASFVNHVPRELLLGPAQPVAYPLDMAARYTGDMFSLPRPASINATPLSAELATAISSRDGAAARRLLDQALLPLVAMKRKPGGGVGFFEQGFLINAGLLLTLTISVTAASAVWLVKNGRVPRWS